MLKIHIIHIDSWGNEHPHEFLHEDIIGLQAQIRDFFSGQNDSLVEIKETENISREFAEILINRYSK